MCVFFFTPFLDVGREIQLREDTGVTLGDCIASYFAFKFHWTPPDFKGVWQQHGLIDIRPWRGGTNRRVPQKRPAVFRKSVQHTGGSGTITQCCSISEFSATEPIQKQTIAILY